MQEQVVERIKDVVYSLISNEGLQKIIDSGPISIYLKGNKYDVSVKGSEDNINISIKRTNNFSVDE